MNPTTLDLADELLSAAAPCVTSSFQAECVVLVHMLQRIKPGIPVLFLDTFHHFAETYAYRDDIAARWNLNLVNLRSERPAIGLWQQDTSACCGTHKVEPLFRALQDYDVWFTGLRRLLPLYDRGYTSIGCEPCTTLPAEVGNERSGRWGGQKLECGIHIGAPK